MRIKIVTGKLNIQRWTVVSVFVAVTVLTVIIVSVFFSSASSASSGHWGATSSHSNTGSRGGSPSWIRVEPSLAGTWLHWREYEYYGNQDSQDPAIGKLLIADIWEHIGTDNVPTLFHARVTFAESGQLYQEVYESSTASVEVQGSAYKATYPSEVDLPATWCVLHWPVNPQRLSKLTPEFVDEGGVKAAGFALTIGSALHTPPATPAASFLPTKVFSAPQQLHQWDQRQTLSQGFVSTTTVQVDASGRVVFKEWRTVDSQGKTVSDTWFSRGDLFVYPGDAPIPADVTSVPQTPQGGC